MTVCVPVASLFAKSDKTSEYVDELLFGDEAEILYEEHGFYKIKSDYGYIGYTEKENLCESNITPQYTVTTLTADLLSEPRYHLAPVITLPFGARVSATVSDARFATVQHPNGNIYYIHKNQLGRVYCVHTRDNLVNNAKKYLAVQYRWGGRTHSGIDCSGLCFNAYRACGINIWRDADITKSENLRKIPLFDAKKGDLLFFKGHVAMYLGDGMIIHSSASNGCVTIESFKDNDYLKEIFICVGTAFR